MANVCSMFLLGFVFVVLAYIDTVNNIELSPTASLEQSEKFPDWKYQHRRISQQSFLNVESFRNWFNRHYRFKRNSFNGDDNVVVNTANDPNPSPLLTKLTTQIAQLHNEMMDMKLTMLQLHHQPPLFVVGNIPLPPRCMASTLGFVDPSPPLYHQYPFPYLFQHGNNYPVPPRVYGQFPDFYEPVIPLKTSSGHNSDNSLYLNTPSKATIPIGSTKKDREILEKAVLNKPDLVPTAPLETTTATQTKPFDDKIDKDKWIPPVEDMIMATCRIRPNRHIALLNQQDVRGVIRLWQRRNSANVPLYMQVRLSGFKVDRDSDADCDNQTTQISPNSNENQTSVDNKLDNRKGSMQKFGMHVHESGDMSRDCQSTGHHYNPFMVSHGGPNDIIKHVGDLGNINCDQNGVVEENLVYNHLSLLGEHSIMNRAIVIRNQPDDYGRTHNKDIIAKVIGNPGERIACCVIREVVDTNNFGDFNA